MSKLKSNGPLDELVAEAEKILTDRAGRLEAIAKARSKLAESQAEVAAAQEQVTFEEYENAQTENGVAVASKAAQQRLAEAQLQVKSTILRLQGLQDRLKGPETALLDVWSGLEHSRDEFIREKVAEVRGQFRPMILQVVRLLRKIYALHNQCGGKSSGRYNFSADDLDRICLFNPMGFATDPAIERGVFVRVGGRDGTLSQNWAEDPEARALDQSIEAIKKRLMPIGAVVAEIDAAKKKG